MDSWLWDPPICEDEDNFSPGEDWQPDFCFWHEPDPIENDAANEQACIQVLRILIKNADTEINVLEEDIILLQCQLALTDETFSESWSNALREKIKFLEMSLKRLKNENAQGQDQQEVDDQLQVHGEPAAEKINEILKRLLENQYSLHKDEQNKGSDVESHETSMDKTKLIYSVAEVPGVMTSRQTATPSCSNARKGEDSQQTIAVLRNASGTISRHGADSNIGIWRQSNSKKISAGVEMPSFTKTECATLNSLPKSDTLAKQHKLADNITDSLPDAVEQEQLPSTSAMKPPLGTQGKLGTRSPLEWKKNDEWPYGEGSKSASRWEMLEQMQNTEVTVPEKSAPNLLLRYELEQNPVFKSEPQPAQKLGLAAEKELKPSTVTNIHASKSSEKGKSVRETYLDIMRNRSLYAAPDPSMTLGSQSEKTWKNSSMPPLIKEYKESRNIQTTSEAQKDAAQRVIQKGHRIRSRHRENEAMVDKHSRSLSGSTSMHCEPEQILESLPKETLRNLAKNKNLKGYYKLRKSELVKLLMEEVKDGDLREAYPYLFA